MSFPQTISDRELIQKTGAVYTPSVVVRSLLAYAQPLLPERPLSILEPSVGDGAFLSKLDELYNNISHVTAVDIDERAIQICRSHNHFNHFEIDFVKGDFAEFSVNRISSSSQKFDLIVGNPPFIKKQNFSSSFKQAVSEIGELADYPVSKLKNAWAAFWISAVKMLSDDGVLAFVLPYEIMTVSYGKEILKRAQNEFERVDVFISRERAFRSIDQDAVLFVGQRKSRSGSGLFLNAVGNFATLENSQTTSVELGESDHNSLELNGFLLDEEILTLLREIRGRVKKVSDFSGSAPGIVSGANDFFILRKDEALRRGLENFVIPILKKSSIPSNEIVLSPSAFDDLTNSNPSFLLSVKQRDAEISTSLQEYLDEGEDLGVNLGYKCRNRENWYEVPIVKKEEAFIFKRSHSYPKMHLNEADVYLTDTAYGLRVRDGFSARGVCYSFYNSLTLLFSEIDGRFYGGGVLELSPKEFRGLPMVYKEPSDQEFQEFLEVHKEANGDIRSVIEYGDRWLLKNSSLTLDEIDTIRRALFLVRGHRFRHSGHGQNLPTVPNSK